MCIICLLCTYFFIRFRVRVSYLRSTITIYNSSNKPEAPATRLCVEREIHSALIPLTDRRLICKPTGDTIQKVWFVMNLGCPGPRRGDTARILCYHLNQDSCVSWIQIECSANRQLQWYEVCLKSANGTTKTLFTAPVSAHDTEDGSCSLLCTGAARLVSPQL